MTESHPFLVEIETQLEDARRQVATALADQDDFGVMLARGRLIDLAEIVDRHTDHSLATSAPASA